MPMTYQQVPTITGTAASLAAANQVLGVGQRSLETDTGLEKVGDGLTPYNGRPYVGEGLAAGTQYVLAAYDAISGSGLIAGKPTASGHVWQTGGAGYQTAAIVGGDHVETTANTYYIVDAGVPIPRTTQKYAGPQPTAALLKAADINTMVHAIFTPGGACTITYWLPPAAGASCQFSKKVKNCPAFNDGVPHFFTLDVKGNFAFAYVDGTLVAYAYDTNFPACIGTGMMAQGVTTADKLYGFSMWKDARAAKTDTEFTSAKLGDARIKVLNAFQIAVGDPAAAKFLPSSSSYFYASESDAHTFEAEQHAVVQARAGSGFSASVKAVGPYNTPLELKSDGTGNGTLRYQGADRLTFPFNVARVDQNVPQKLPGFTVATLPSAATFAQCLIYVSDGTANKRLATSDGTNWRWPDGAVVA